MKNNFHTFIFLLITCLAFPVYAADIDANGIVKPMQPYRLVNDFANILNSSEEQQLETKLLSYNDSTSTQIYIVTIDSLMDYPIEEYALKLGRSWQIGQKDKNNGVLILLSKNDRKVDIEVGFGLEAYISDYDSKHIIDELILPAFKNENYFQGLDNATNKIIELAQGTYKSRTQNETIKTNTSSPISTILVILFILFIIYLMYKFPFFAKIVFVVLSSGGSSSGNRSSGGGFGGGGGGSFGGGGSSGSW